MNPMDKSSFLKLVVIYNETTLLGHPWPLYHTLLVVTSIELHFLSLVTEAVQHDSIRTNNRKKIQYDHTLSR